jgi:hypothetical protein
MPSASEASVSPFFNSLFSQKLGHFSLLGRVPAAHFLGRKGTDQTVKRYRCLFPLIKNSNYSRNSTSLVQ